MMQNRIGRESDTTEEERELLEQIAGSVEECLDQRTALEATLSDLAHDRLRGKPVQSELNEVFDRCESLVQLTQLGHSGLLEGSLDKAETADVLSTESREAFDAFWDMVDWIEPGIEGYIHEREGRPFHWTEKHVDFDNDSGELTIEHSLDHGVDEIHRMRVPAAKFFVDAVQRLKVVIGMLPGAIQHADLDPEDLQQIFEQQEELEEIAGTFEALTAVIEDSNVFTCSESGEVTFDNNGSDVLDEIEPADIDVSDVEENTEEGRRMFQ